MATVKLAFDCPRELAAGLELIAIADGVRSLDRPETNRSGRSRARRAAAGIGEAGKAPALSV